MSERRILECMERARQGEELTIGYIGGSITQGSLASEESRTYAKRVFQWWKDTFPKAGLHYVNGGIGGTCSLFGAARVEADLLMYQPDFVVVDFSVNDEPDELHQETFEGLIRKLLSWPSRPAVLVLNNVYYDSGRTAQRQHNLVASHYQIPCVSIRDTLYQGLLQGRYSLKELTPDGLHPGDRGHELVAGEIIRYLEQIRAKPFQLRDGSLEEEARGQRGENFRALAGHEYLPEPVTENGYAHVARWNIASCMGDFRGSGINPSGVSATFGGFRADTREKLGHLDLFRNGWIGRRRGDWICFTAECSSIAVQYQRTIKGISCRARLVLDGDEAGALELDGTFDERWGDCLYLQPVLHHGIRKAYQIRIEITEEGDEKLPFYLASLLLA